MISIHSYFLIRGGYHLAYIRCHGRVMWTVVKKDHITMVKILKNPWFQTSNSQNPNFSWKKWLNLKILPRNLTTAIPIFLP